MIAALAIAGAALLAAACAGDAAPNPANDGLLVMSDGGEQLFTVRADGTGRTTLPAAGATPSWTPDGRIIFVSARGGSPQIWIMDSDGGRPAQVGELHLSMNNHIAKPQMARTGLIAFSDQEGSPTQTADNPGPQNGTWLMQQDGSGLRQLLPNCTAPSLALSGRWLTCTLETQEPYRREIYRINTDGTGLKQLTFPDDPDYPDANASNISPDETMVAIFSGKEADQGLDGFSQSAFTFGHRNIALVPANGGARRNVTDCKPLTNQAELAAFVPGGCIVADNPAWSPDGRWIIYDRGSPKPGDNGTWIIDLNGANNQRLSPDLRGAGNVPMKFVSGPG